VLPAAEGVVLLWLADTVNTPAAAGYVARIEQGTDIRIIRYVAGTPAFLDGEDVAISAGDGVAFLADDDDTLSVWRYTSGSWSQVATATDDGIDRRDGPFYQGVESNDATWRAAQMLAGPLGGRPGPSRGTLGLLGVGR
jgi:hypothetical protein